LDTPRRIEIASGAQVETAFSVADVSRCIRAFAVSGEPTQELELELLDEVNQSHGKDSRRAPFAMVAGAGTLCLKKPGNYRAVVRARRAAGPVLVQVYQAR
jgi:hypothetical protein